MLQVGALRSGLPSSKPTINPFGTPGDRAPLRLFQPSVLFHSPLALRGTRGLSVHIPSSQGSRLSELWGPQASPPLCLPAFTLAVSAPRKACSATLQSPTLRPLVPEAREPLVRRQGRQVSMRVARGSASWLSSHGSLHWVAKVLELQLQHQSFQ